jgi:DUF4097 and DUF4098 domain-containing protein YvlB
VPPEQVLPFATEPTMRTSRLFLSLFAVAAMAQTAPAQRSSDEWLESCRRNRSNGQRNVCEVRESRIPARGTLRVDGAQNGGVTVRAHEGRDVIVRARVQAYARSEEVARDLARGIRVTTSGTIRAEGPSRRRSNEGWAVGYEILVPARTNLEVETQNGPITVERLAGDIDLQAHNGPITLRGLSGDVRARTVNGPINVFLSGRRWSGEGLDAETVNGPVRVEMPRGYGARLEASTVHGPIRTPSNIRPARQNGRRWGVGGRIDTELNGGGPTIRAVTTNGPVTFSEEG